MPGRSRFPIRSRFKASGKNDAWFALFFIGAVLVVGLLANARDSHAPGRPAPVPAIEIKD